MPYGSNLNEWLFYRDQLDASPSRKHYSREEEDRLRRQGIEAIYQFVNRLKLPLNVFTAASTHFHRFYTKHSFRAYSSVQMAFACVYMASKSEDFPKKMKHYIQAMFQVDHELPPPPSLDEESQPYIEARKMLVDLELILIITLHFDFSVENPYRILTDICRFCKFPEHFYQATLYLINDSYSTDLCLRYPVQDIVAACVVLTSQSFGKGVLDMASEADTAHHFFENHPLLEEIGLELVEFYHSRGVALMEALPACFPNAASLEGCMTGKDDLLNDGGKTPLGSKTPYGNKTPNADASSDKKA